MGSKERREREKQELRERILDAARELFVKEGIEAVTMRSLAKHIEYSPTAIYLHFKDKESLLKELCANDLLALHSAMQKIVASEPDVVKRLYKVAEAFVVFALEHRAQYQLVFMMPKPEIDEDEAEFEPHRIAYAQLRDNWAEVVASGRLKPEFKDPDLLAQLWFTGIHGIVSLYIMQGKCVMQEWRNPIDQAKAYVQAILKGILK